MSSVSDREYDYIVVDLDGTLVRTDLFLEAILKLVKRNPLNIFRLAVWLLQGRAIAKDRVAGLVQIDAESVPYEATLVDYLRARKQSGQRIIIASASHASHATEVADHLGLFDKVIATTSDTNMKGVEKLRAIRAEIGDARFAYAGDSAADRPIWRAATANIFVNAPRRDVEHAQAQGKAEKIISSRPPVGSAFIRQMRPLQWSKNILVFVPLLTSHGYLELGNLWAAVLAFLCFGLSASGAYFLNDLLDLDSDRRHASKRDRPLASGGLSLSVGIIGAAGLPLIAFALASAALPMAFVSVLAAYFLITNAYSFFLKGVSTADVMTLAVLYTLRVVAGAAAVGIAPSSWLMAFSVFVFVSLAYLKRYIEVSSLAAEESEAPGRGYSAADRETMFSLGIANTTAAVLVLALYINSEEMRLLYKTPELLWILCFLMLYWGNRIWIGARRRKITEDPVVFATRDRVSWAVAIACMGVVILARYLPPFA